jgi:hypothetical protein
VVPTSRIVRGKPWKTSIYDCEMEVDESTMHLEISFSTWTKHDLVDSTVFGKTITRLIKQFNANLPPFFGDKLPSFVQRSGGVACIS